MNCIQFPFFKIDDLAESVENINYVKPLPDALRHPEKVFIPYIVVEWGYNEKWKQGPNSIGKKSGQKS